MRRLRIAGLAALGGLLVWVLVGLPIFVFPATGPLPAHADVALVLGPDVPQRIALSEQLLKNGTVDELLWSTPPELHDVPNPLLTGPCRTMPHVTCFAPVPGTTQGEARELAAQAAQNDWTSAIVITQSAHLERANLIVGRCFSGRVTMAASGEPPSGGWAWEYLYQTLATVKAWIHPGC